MSDKLKEAVAKLIPALEAVEGANDLLARVKEEVKEDLELNPNAVTYGIKRAMKKKLKPEDVELQDGLYEKIFF